MRRLIFATLLLAGCCPDCSEEMAKAKDAGWDDAMFTACPMSIARAKREAREEAESRCPQNVKYDLFEQYFWQRETEELKARAQRIDELEKKVVELKMQNYDLLRLVPQQVEENEGR